MKPIKLKELITHDRGKKAKELIELAKKLTIELEKKARSNGHLS